MDQSDCKTHRRVLRTFLVLASAAVLLWGVTLTTGSPQPAKADGAIICVNRAATGANNGSCWGDAFTSLETALEAAQVGDEVWVTAGIYTPTITPGLTTTFILKPGVAVYGGFAATETLRSQRDWSAHITVLSGDLGGDDHTDLNGVVTDTDNMVGENAYHVVTGVWVTESAVLDGFIITAGYANDAINKFGAGMYTYASAPSLAHLTFSGNWASWWGGGLVNLESEIVMTDVVFINNYARYGGGMYNEASMVCVTQASFSGNRAELGGAIDNTESELELVNVAIKGNQAAGGGGIYNYESMVFLTNTLLSGNLATVNGGSVYSFAGETYWVNASMAGNRAVIRGGGFYDYESYSTFVNSIIWGNSAPNDGQYYSTNAQDLLLISFSDIQGGYSGAGNIAADPRFIAPASADLAPTSAGNYRLLPGPAVNAGDNTAVSQATDLDGQPRIRHGTVDLGAYEGLFRWVYLPLVRK
jgi:hypothetical protein